MSDEAAAGPEKEIKKGSDFTYDPTFMEEYS
jgi:hypothetical protein